MTHAAVTDGAKRLEARHFAIRSRLYSGLCKGTMGVGPLADDERLKLVLPQACAYCGEREHLSVDHLIARKYGGVDAGDNMVWACRSCNSSKGAKDVLAWLRERKRTPSLLLVRRYLKLAIAYCVERDLLDRPIAEAGALPFSLQALPRLFTRPDEWVLWTAPLG